MANQLLPAGGATGEVGQTAGLGGPSFINGLMAVAGMNLPSGMGGLPNMQGLGYGMGGPSYTPGLFADNTTVNGVPVTRVPSDYQVPSAGGATPGLAGGSVGSAAPSLAQVLGMLVGQAPVAPTSADFGAAPSLADFFSADPYNQALNQLASGKTAAAGTINSAYTAAAQQLAKIASTAGASTNQALGQAKTDSQNAVTNLNNLAAGASAQAGAGGQVQARLAALQGILGGQNAAQQALDNQMASVQKQNQADNASALTSSQQNASNFLASQVLGEQNKIGLAESQDKARAQQELAAANNSRGVDMARAGTTYQSQQKSYQDAIARYMGLASKGVAGESPQGGADWAKGQEANWAQAGAQGDQNAASIVSAINHVLTPIQSGGATKPPTYEQALAQMFGNASQMGGVQSPMFGIVSNWLKNYYGVQKNGQLGGQQPPSQDQMAQFLYNTYLGG